MRQLSQPYGTRKEEFHCPHNVFSVAAPHLPPSAMDDIVNIVAKKNPDKQKCEYFASEMQKNHVRHASVLPRRPREVATGPPLHHRSDPIASQKLRRCRPTGPLQQRKISVSGPKKPLFSLKKLHKLRFYRTTVSLSADCDCTRYFAIFETNRQFRGKYWQNEGV